ncbi:DUF4294 domain-containing protein [Nemorincola caseinilytica]
MKQLIIIATLIFSVGNAHAQGLGGYMLDTVYMLPEARVTEKFKNDTDRYHYNQTKYYVTTILPYLDAATKLFREIDKKVNEPGISKRERKAYVNAREDEMRREFEDRVKQLNVTQGTLLVKLVTRQTELNIYKMLQEFKNPLTAVKWQAWARFNGLNLDKKYDPNEENMLELIMEDLGYPLPVGYRAAVYANGAR